jgi:SAM-dependent methyltransferase
MASTYIHGSSAGEHERLAWMNGLLNARELAAIAPRGDERALEMGAGTALFACALAGRLARGSVIAVERDGEQLAAARRNADGCPNLELRQGDVLAPPLAEGEWGSFDLVHARFLLEHLEAPGAAVEVMVRAARPGGRVVLVDDDHDNLRLWPESPRFQRLWRAYCEQYTLRGLDPCVGRRLATLLHAAGAREVRTDAIHFGACAGMPEFEPALDNLMGVVAGAADAVAASGCLSETSIRAGLAELSAWRERCDATLWYALPFAAGTKPASGTEPA